jgi:hypothetical protein
MEGSGLEMLAIYYDCYISNLKQPALQSATSLEPQGHIEQQQGQ